MWKYVKRYLFFAMIAGLFMVGEVSMDLVQPGIMSQIVDDGVLGLNNGGVSSLPLIWKLGIRMIFLVLFGGLCGSLNNVFVHYSSQNIGNDIRKDCFRKIMDFSFPQLDKFGTGSLVTRVTNDITQVQNFVAQFVRGMIRTLMLTFGSMYCMFRLNRDFGLIVLCAFPLLAGCLAFCITKANPLFTRLQAKLDSINAIMQEDVAGIRIIKACVREIYEKIRFGKANDELIGTQLKVLVIFAFMNPACNALMYIVVAIILLAGSYEVGGGGATPGAIMAAITYTTQLLNGILMLVMLFQNISRGIASWGRVKEILDSEPELKDGAFDGKISRTEYTGEDTETALVRKNGAFDGRATHSEDFSEQSTDNGNPRKNGAFAKSAARSGDFAKLSTDSTPTRKNGVFDGQPPRTGDIEFRDVSFAYPGSTRKVLEHISLTIHKGETFAIMGTTGCGKTTLVNLIPRFYDVTEGAVLVDGVDVRDYKQKALRNKVASVLQKSELFSASISENIAWGAPGASAEAIRAAALTAQADDFISASPEGYDTPVAERGMSLSGGQKQRVSIARAVLKSAEILIFDDSTSALDLKTEANLYAALRRSSPQSTKIIVAQRIASVRSANRIAVLDKGRIAACGSHEELMRTCPQYQDIYHSQLGEEEKHVCA